VVAGLIGIQLMLNICHVTVHHFALNALCKKDARPTALSKLLIYTGGLACIAFVGIVGSQLQKEQQSEDSQFPDSGRGSGGRVFFDFGFLGGGRFGSVPCAVGGWGLWIGCGVCWSRRGMGGCR
jgi:hypothetical protein